jgi:polyisoprenoid-binding protein YceI
MSVAENTGAQMLASGSWQVDPVHSAVEFRVGHMMIATIKGRFRDFDGAIVSGEAPSVAGSIRVASLETLDARRDEHDGGERIAFALRGELDRTDFGLVWNRALETGGMMVGNTVELALDVSAVRAQ